MKKYIEANKRIFLLIIIMIIFIFTINYYLKNTRPEVEQARTLTEIVDDIDLAHKNVRLFNYEEQEIDLATVIPESVAAWEEFVEAYLYSQPEEYKKTRNWAKKLLLILEYIRKAEEYTQENRLSDAYNEAEAARVIFKAIKDENGILDISDEVIVFYAASRIITEAATKEEVLVNLPLLKYRFTILKQFSIDAAYNQLISDLETAIGNLDKLLDGPDYIEARSELEPLFSDIYLNY